MNKEQSADDPSVDLIRVKICLIAPFLSYLMFALHCRQEHKVSLKHSEQLRQRW